TLVLILGFVDGIDPRRPLLEMDIIAFPHAKVLAVNFHVSPSGGCCGSCRPSAHSVADGVGSGGAFALAPGLGSASVSALGLALVSGLFAVALGASAWVIAAAMMRPASSGSLTRPARRRSPSDVSSSVATPALASGLGSVSGLGSALASGWGAALASGLGSAFAF